VAEQLEEILGVLVGLVDLARAGFDLVLGQPPHGLLKLSELLGEGEIHAPRSYRLGRLAALAGHAPAFLLGGPTPDAVVLAVGEGVLEARFANDARGTDCLGFRRLLLGRGIEDGGIQAPARTLQAPGQVHHITSSSRALPPACVPAPDAAVGPRIMEPASCESPGSTPGI